MGAGYLDGFATAGFGQGGGPDVVVLVGVGERLRAAQDLGVRALLLDACEAVRASRNTCTA